ncbi:MAG: hypothetical protein ABI591_33265 [Kofleriaceae bacterium]
MAGVLCLIGGNAFAQVEDPAAPPPPPDGTNNGSAAPAATDADWPLAINDRPLTLATGKFEIHGGIPFATTSTTNAMGMSSSSTSELLAVGATYGVAPKLEIGADYALRINPDASGKGFLDFHAGYMALHSGKLDISLLAGISMLFQDSVDATGMATTNTFASLQLGAAVRYQLASKISIFTGNPGTPNGLPGFLSFVFPPVGYQLSFGLNNSGPAYLALPVGIGLQATPNIYAFAATNIATIKIANASNSVIFSDAIPLAVGGFYSMPKLDLGVQISDDLKNAGDLYILQLVARYYLK